MPGTRIQSFFFHLYIYRIQKQEPNCKICKALVPSLLVPLPLPPRKTLTPPSLLLAADPQPKSEPLLISLGSPLRAPPCRTCSRSSATSSSSSSDGKPPPHPGLPIRFRRRCSGALIPVHICGDWSERWRARMPWRARQRSFCGRWYRNTGWAAVPTRRPRSLMPYAPSGSSSSPPIQSVKAPTHILLNCDSIVLQLH